MPAAALLVLWFALLRLVSYQWMIFEDHGYGWSVPFLSLYLLWLRLQPSLGLSAVDQRDAERSPKTLVTLGAFLALLLLPLRWVQEANLLWRPTLWLSILSGIGITVCLLRLGGGRKLVAKAAFPLGFLLVAVPLPSAIESPLTQSFMRANAATVAEMLVLSGIPALRSGNTIDTGNGVVGVDDACSGIRSFQACLMLALFFGELHRLSVVRRLALLFSGVACSFLFNVARTTLLTVVASRQGTDAVGHWHDPAGVGILVGCFTTLLLLSLWLRKGMTFQAAPRGGEVAASFQMQDAPSSSGSVSQLLPVGDSVNGSQNLAPLLAAGASPALRLFSVGLIGWLILTEIAVEGWYRWHERRMSQQFSWVAEPPASGLGLQRGSLSENVTRAMLHDEGWQAMWRDEQGAEWVANFLRWKTPKSVLRRAQLEEGRSHYPEICLTGLGMKYKSQSGSVSYTSHGLRLVFDRYLFEWQGRPVYVFFTIDTPITGSVGAFRRSNPHKRVQLAWAGFRRSGQSVLELAVTGYSTGAEAEKAFQRQISEMIHVAPSAR